MKMFVVYFLEHYCGGDPEQLVFLGKSLAPFKELIRSHFEPEEILCECYGDVAGVSFKNLAGFSFFIRKVEVDSILLVDGNPLTDFLRRNKDR